MTIFYFMSVIAIIQDIRAKFLPPQNAYTYYLHYSYYLVMISYLL